MTYQVLARKWRPQTFADIVGQEHISRTLQNAIATQRVGHAYLFVGPRGIGKTTSARVFAKALNCEAGIVTEPCCECQSCREIAGGSSLDVVEIDGASHNKVEHIRDIRENVQYAPSRSRYKIYIIDEVHMLSTAAWNALLKTLEDPPSHVKFLFATTEPHKVLPTIISRCQRFDLKRIPVPLIMARLEQISEHEGVHIEDRALAAIARAADGGMRDAQSIFDQMIAFCGGMSAAEKILESDVIDVFGLASGAELRELALGLVVNDMDRALRVVQALADHGRDLERLFGDLVLFMRNAMICSFCRDPESLLEVSDGELEDLRQVTQAGAPGLIQRLLQELVAQEWSFRAALNKRVHLEATLARVMMDVHSVKIDDIINRLNELRGTGEIPAIPIAPAPAKPALSPSAAPPPVQPTSSSSVSSAPVPLPAPPAAVAPPPAPAPVSAPEPAAETARTPVQAPAAVGGAAHLHAPPTAVAPEATAVPPAPAESEGSREERRIEDGAPPAPAVVGAELEPERSVRVEGSQMPSDAQEAPEPAPPSSVQCVPETGAASADAACRQGETPEAAPSVSEGDPARLWHQLVDEVDKTPGHHQLKLYMQELIPVSFMRGVLQVAYDQDVPEAHAQKLLEPSAIDVLNRCFQRVSPVPHGRIMIKRWIDSVSNEEQREQLRSTPELRAKLEQNPFVKQVCTLFNGIVVDVRG